MKKIVIILGVLGTIIFGIYNIINNDDFLKAPLTTMISILVAIVLSYFFTQRKTDDRRKMEKIDNLLYKIQDIILDKEFIVVQDSDLIVHRSIANKIKYLKDNAPCDLKSDVDRLEDIFEDYRLFYGEHYMDKDYMEKSKKDLLNYVMKFDDVCDSLHMRLL